MSFGMVALMALAAVLGDQPSKASAVPLAGDWVLVGSTASGQMSVSADGTTVNIGLTTSDEEIEARYRVTGARGAAWMLDLFTPLPARQEEPSVMAPRARILPISPGVALWWQPQLAMMAYRKRSLPQAFQGRYVIDKSSSGIRVVEVSAESVTRQMGARDADGEDDNESGPRRLQVVAITDVDANSARIVLGDRKPMETLRIQLQGSRATLVREVASEPDEEMHARFVPVVGKHGLAQGKPTGAAVVQRPGSENSRPESAKHLPLAPDEFRLSLLGGSEESLLRVSGAGMTILPLSGSSSTSGPARVVATLSPGAMRLGLGISHRNSDNFTIRHIANEVLLMESGKNIYVAYRLDSPPPWAPMIGLAEDVRLLCSELEAVGRPAPGGTSTDGVVSAAFERAGRGAHSDVMRSIVDAIVPANFAQRVRLLEKGLHDAGEPIPACSGLDRLRQLSTVQ